MLMRKALGRLSGVPSSTILNYEERRTVPGVDRVEELALALDVSPGWLAYGEGSDHGLGVAAVLAHQRPEVHVQRRHRPRLVRRVRRRHPRRPVRQHLDVPRVRVAIA